MAYPYNGHFSGRRKQITDALKDESQKSLCCVQEAKLKRLHALKIHLSETLENRKLQWQKAELCVPAAAGGRRDWLHRDRRECLWVMEMFYITVGWWLYKCLHLSLHHTAHLKRMNLIVSKLYHNKTDLKLWKHFTRRGGKIQPESIFSNFSASVKL